MKLYQTDGGTSAVWQNNNEQGVIAFFFFFFFFDDIEFDTDIDKDNSNIVSIKQRLNQLHEENQKALQCTLSRNEIREAIRRAANSHNRLLWPFWLPQCAPAGFFIIWNNSGYNYIIVRYFLIVNTIIRKNLDKCIFMWYYITKVIPSKK